MPATTAITATVSVGNLIPADMLLRIATDTDVKGTAPADYDVVGVRTVADDAERHWDYLKGVWRDLRKELPLARPEELPADPTGRAASQWLEPLFAELGFGLLTRVGPDGITSDDGQKTFAISHRWNHVPIHLAPWNAELDKRPGGSGAVPPQSLVQECLNRTEAHLWAVLANGRRLRLLRDSSALATASYVEFDLEAIFDGELFSEFVLLYRMLHATRFKVAADAPPSSCWLETWRTDAISTGMRALDHQREGVQRALTALGTGFLQHPANDALRQNLDIEKFHAALLRLAYRMIFLFVIEDRDVLHGADVPDLARERYAAYFSSARLRRLANRRRGSAHTDLYQALLLVLNALGDEQGCPELGLPGLGGLFDDTGADTPLRGMALSNEHLLKAVDHLARVRDAGSARWRPVDYRNMGSEELGSIYESLLELVPKHSAVDRTFQLVDRAGNDRKKTGSYYTPSSLIEKLLDSSLDPVIDDAQKRGEQKATAAGVTDPAEVAEIIAAELLALTVCDPACGSGHFLVAAARRIAKRVAAVREQNPEPTLDAVRHALHEVIGRCVYGVDLNPMAVELAKVSLWLEAMEPGKPLGFLDARIKLGNSLIGATPALLRGGIPNKAFKAAEGDDAKFAAALFKQNEEERSGQGSLFSRSTQAKISNTTFAEGLRQIAAVPADTLRDVRRQKAAYRDWATSPEYLHDLHVADAWCAAFMWFKTPDAPPAITHEVFREIQNPNSQGVPQETHDEIVRLSEEYRFFHWHLEFPEIFTVPDGDATTAAEINPDTGWMGGFSCILANPPWDKVIFEDTKYFSVVEPSIANLSGVERRKRIVEWVIENPEAGKRYHAARRRVKSIFLFAGSSGMFPLCAKGLTIKGVNSLQIDQLFVELFTSILSPEGRIGCIIPTTIATGASAQYLFSTFTQRSSIASLYDFDNRKPLFLDVESRYRFCLFSAMGSALQEGGTKFVFSLTEPSDLDTPGKIVRLSAEEISLINPNTLTFPLFKARRDAELTLAIYKRIPVLLNERKIDGNPWDVNFRNLFNSTDDSDLFQYQENLESSGWVAQGIIFSDGDTQLLPVLEGKMIHLFDHRWNHYYGVRDNDYEPIPSGIKSSPNGTGWPRRWIQADGSIQAVRKGKRVSISGVRDRLHEADWKHEWLYGWREIARAADERTAIPAFAPLAAPVETFPILISPRKPTFIGALAGIQSSLIFDFVTRQKASGAHIGRRIWKQLPVPTPVMLEPHLSFVVPRVTELVYTTYDMAPLAQDLGDEGPPFQWDEERRAQIRAELDAYFFFLYGISREDTEYILETFQSDSKRGLKNNEIAKYGTYRTRDLVLAAYDRMAPLGVDLDVPLIDGENYTSPLSPAPGHGPRHPAQPDVSNTPHAEGDAH
ncbi:Eco57I restriction-modification methylase domain-containing protein [Actinomadura parmotrematis]|uniref:site-specific DNA-methyltransferase (adenine-specific) n=1 Tax=Actinomadura parmotrematis TaxID=2864039 RepID=A0ABS7FUS1_9ACTN|nr:DNA methyltransferase [Actinomadura parmotrematis]MBW8483940.1 SAM-dependent DNA methyltransferase [Actinomadura parmotrematis]